MALTMTTLSAACPLVANTISVASATGFVAGAWVKIDQEFMQVQKGYPIAGTSVLVVPVYRGLDGTATQAHPITAQVKVGVAADFLGPAPQETTLEPIGSPARTRTSLSAAGAIPLPSPGNDSVCVLNGTVAIAATLANPTTDMDGCTLTVIGNGKAAHTITYTAGLGNVGGTADVITFAAAQAQGIQLMACGGFWCGLGMNTAVAGAGATINGVGLG